MLLFGVDRQAIDLISDASFNQVRAQAPASRATAACARLSPIRLRRASPTAAARALAVTRACDWPRQVRRVVEFEPDAGSAAYHRWYECDVVVLGKLASNARRLEVRASLCGLSSLPLASSALQQKGSTLR